MALAMTPKEVPMASLLFAGAGWLWLRVRRERTSPPEKAR